MDNSGRSHTARAETGLACAAISSIDYDISATARGAIP